VQVGFRPRSIACKRRGKAQARLGGCHEPLFLIRGRASRVKPGPSFSPPRCPGWSAVLRRGFGPGGGGPGGWWFALAGGRDRAPGLAGVSSAWPQFKGIRPGDQNHPGGLRSCLLIAPQWGQRLVDGPEPGRCGRARCQGRQSVPGYCCSPSAAHRRIAASYLGLVFWAFFPAIGCAA